jgi:hypothetical protein
MPLCRILGSEIRPALLIGNGINRYGSREDNFSWETLLRTVATSYRLTFTEAQLRHMSNTEFFDILDLAKPLSDRTSLQRLFCELLADWKPRHHHRHIVQWAKLHDAPIITVNFDDLLAQATNAQFYRQRDGFTDFYPWKCYFSHREIGSARSSHAIWHAHGFAKYSRSVRLGLTHYMGSVQRARGLIYGSGGLRDKKLETADDWAGRGTWLEPFFFCPIAILGLGFTRDETFLRWLFLERARFHRIRPEFRTEAWIVERHADRPDDSRAFFKELGIETLYVREYGEIYENVAWMT